MVDGRPLLGIGGACLSELIARDLLAGISFVGCHRVDRSFSAVVVGCAGPAQNGRRSTMLETPKHQLRHFLPMAPWSSRVEIWDSASLSSRVARCARSPCWRPVGSFPPNRSHFVSLLAARMPVSFVSRVVDVCVWLESICWLVSDRWGCAFARCGGVHTNSVCFVVCCSFGDAHTVGSWGGQAGRCTPRWVCSSSCGCCTSCFPY